MNRKKLGLVAIIVAALFALTSCEGGQAWIATVDGKEISSKNFAEGAEQFALLQQSQQQSPSRVGVLPMSSASSWVQFLVTSSLIEKLAAQENVTVSDSKIEDAKKEISAGLPNFAKAPAWLQDKVAHMSALQQALLDEFGKGIDQTAAARQVYEQSKIGFTNYCFDMVMSASQADADAVHKRVADGEDFVAVAKDVATTDFPAVGEKEDGDIGCQPASSINQVLGSQPLAAMDAAKANELLDVFESQGVFYVIRMREREVQPFEEVKDQILANLGSPGEQKFNQKAQKLIAETEIKVNPRFGTWSPDAGLMAPKGAERPAGTKAITSTLTATQG